MIVYRVAEELKVWITFSESEKDGKPLNKYRRQMTNLLWNI